MERAPVVMFVDDDEFQLEFVGDLLRDLGVTEVLTANSGKQGLDLFDSLARKPDLLLCDLQMTDMDGIEFLRHVAERDYPGGIGVVSAMDAGLRKAAETLAHAYSLNLFGVVEKPATREALLALLSGVDRTQLVPAAQTNETPLTLEELRDGLALDQLEVFFQPKVTVAERRVVSAEALARWRHPVRGLLGPQTFIALAEQHGLIDQLTLAVLRRVTTHMLQWQRYGIELKAAVNLSTHNLSQLDLPEIIAGIVMDAGMDPRRIVLEITESGVAKDFRLSLDILTRLRLKGFSLSVDDFGTGYANMKVLKQLPFSELKIDRAFVCGATSDPTSRAILESSVQLARSLGLNLVAEGVETRDDWDLIRSMGCNEAQGYFIAKPMPADQLLAWKKKWEDEWLK